MARPPKRERRLSDLQCNNCGHQFMGLAWWVSQESEERGTIGWNPDTTGASGNKCPKCGSPLIGLQRD